MVMPARKKIQPVLRRILHEAGSLKASDAVARVTEAFPDLTPEEQEIRNERGTDKKWTNRVHWARQDLVIAGDIDSGVRGMWQLTEQGRARARAEIDAEGEDESDKQPAVAEPSPPFVPLPLREEALAGEIAEAARDSGNPGRLEHAAAEALRYFGYEVQEIGGAGETDVLADAPLGPRHYRLVLDAKSSASGRVGDNQVNWLSIERHRAQAEADYAVVVGPDFAGGAMRENAEKFDVCLLSAEELASLVRLHAQRPLSLVELAAVFGSSPTASEALAEAYSAAHERLRRAALVRFALERIDQFNHQVPDTVMAKPEVLWGAVLSATDPALQGATSEEVAGALELLRIAGVLSGDAESGYAAQTSLAGGLKMVQALSNVVGEAPEPPPAASGGDDVPGANAG